MQETVINMILTSLAARTGIRALKRIWLGIKEAVEGFWASRGLGLCGRGCFLLITIPTSTDLLVVFFEVFGEGGVIVQEYVPSRDML